MALPTSYAQEAAIQAIQDRIAALSGVYNPQRLALYAEGQRSLTDQGLYDPRALYVEQAGQISPEGSATFGLTSPFGLTGQPSWGRAYREQLSDTAGAFGSRGAFFGSARADQQLRQVEALNNARDAIQRRIASEQQGITGQQTEQRAGLAGDLGTAQGSYADWRASQQAAIDEDRQGVVPSDQAPVARPRQWTGTAAPNLGSLSSRWGIPVKQIRVTRPGGGGYLARSR